MHEFKQLVNTYNDGMRGMNSSVEGRSNIQNTKQIQEDEKMDQKQNTHNHFNEDNEQHSMVCNDQLFFQELRIAAEEAERDRIGTDQNKAK